MSGFPYQKDIDIYYEKKKIEVIEWLLQYIKKCKGISLEEQKKLLDYADKISFSTIGELNTYIQNLQTVSTRDKKRAYDYISEIEWFPKDINTGVLDGKIVTRVLDRPLDAKLAKLPKTKKENFNISKVAKYISTTGGLVDAMNPTALQTMQSKNAIVTIDLQKDEDVTLSSKNITLFDLAVMDSTYTLFKNGCRTFTPEMVARIMSGNVKGDVKPQKAGAVTKSLRKLALIRVTLDCTEEYIERGIKLRKGDRALYTDYLLPMSEVQLKSVNGSVYLNGFELKEMPVLYEYAERIGRIASVPIGLMHVPGITDTDDGILVRRYVIQRIEELKRARNKAKLNNIIYYDTERERGAMSELWYSENFKNIRDKKAKLHKMVVKILDSFKKEQYIKDYIEIVEGRSIVGVEIKI